MQSIFGKIGKMTFIRQAGFLKRVWQFRFKNIQWRYCGYIESKFGQIGPVIPEIERVTTVLFGRDGKNGISH